VYKNGLKTIVVCTAQLQTEFQNILCRDIARKATELGYNVAFVCWEHPFGQSKSYIKGESNIFNLPDFENADGVIYLKDTFQEETIEHELEERLRKIDIPKVAVRCMVDGFYNMTVDNAKGISDMVKHFIKEHKCTKIAYMSGKRDLLDAQLRLEAYEKVLQEHNIYYDESYIFHGNYWRDKAKEACDHFLSSPIGVPEAIVCANDYMALSVMDELISRGYKIPDDIKLSGFDNMSEAKYSVPSLSSIDMPIEKMAFGAVEIIDNVIKGKPQEMDVYIDAEPVYANSCGCGDDDIWMHIRQRKKTMIEHQEVLDANRNLRYMAVALETASSLEQVSKIVDDNMYILNNYKNFFMCLTRKGESDDKSNVSIIKKGYSKESLCALAIVDRGHTEDYPLVFDTADLVPPIYVNEEPQVYYFMPLHFLDINYGYVAINYYDNGRMKESFLTFITHISSALDSIYNKLKLQKTLNELELMYVTDSLTNLYNRRGFELNAAEIFERCKKKNVPAMVMTIDMDNMKSINDNYGHMQGDIAIKMVGKALSYATTGKEICARVGGDEFHVIAGDYSMDEYERFINSVLEYMKGYNEVNSMPFRVEISYGSVLIEEFEVGNLEYYINISDNRMYKQKFKKKNSRGATEH